MNRIYTQVMAVSLAFTLYACGLGPKGVSEGDSDELSDPNSNSQRSYGSACATNAPGSEIDSDNDGMSDACEEELGLPGNSNDCDQDGIPDDQDDPNDCAQRRDRECDAACQERQGKADLDFRHRLYQKVADSLLLGHGAIRQDAPEGTTIDVDRQLLAFGTLGNITATEFQARLKDDPRCQDANTIFLLAEGRVGYTSTGRTGPAIIEFCGTLTLPSGKSLDQGADLDGATIPSDAWKAAWAYGAGVFNPKALESPGTTAMHTFEELRVSSPHVIGDDTIFDRLDFDMDLELTFFDRAGAENYISNEVYAEEIKHSWKRIGTMSEQAPYSPGFKGFWGSCRGYGICL